MRIYPRYSIAGLMGLVLVVSIGLTALHSGSAAWAGLFYLLTYAIHGLALVGAVCRGPSERAWWLGFSLFGLGYMGWESSWGHPANLDVPTNSLICATTMPGPDGRYACGAGGGDCAWIVGHCLCSLMLALVGGVTAHALFAGPAASPAGLEGTFGAGAPILRGGRRRGVVAGLLAFVVVVTTSAAVVLAPLRDSAFWVGLAYLFTLAILGFTVLGGAWSRGSSRTACLGAALFGFGYLALVRCPDSAEPDSYRRLVLEPLLQPLRPWLPVSPEYPAKTSVDAVANRQIQAMLERRIPMRFREETPLDEVLHYIRQETRASDGREIPIYVDPIGMQEAEKTLKSTITIDLEGVPLRRTMPIALKQLGLAYYVEDGACFITYENSDNLSELVDYPLLLGHCLLALITGGLGALLGFSMGSRAQAVSAV